MNHELRVAFEERVITREPTATYSPESNGVVERCNRTLLELVRSLLHHSRLPGQIWGEALQHANTLRNVAPVASHGKTPWEVLTG